MNEIPVWLCVHGLFIFFVQLVLILNLSKKISVNTRTIMGVMGQKFDLELRCDIDM